VKTKLFHDMNSGDGIQNKMIFGSQCTATQTDGEQLPELCGGLQVHIGFVGEHHLESWTNAGKQSGCTRRQGEK
jgi:hypothetical protein